MAINTIDNYPEITELTENDYLPVATPTGLKKVKGSNVGGGGGAGDFVVEFSITPGDPFTVDSETTFAEIYAAYQQGKTIRGVGTITGMFDIMLVVTQISDTDVVFFTFIEAEAGEGIYATIRGNSSGYSMYLYQ